MKLVNNYLENLKRHLPEEEQQEVAEELEASIYGQIEDKEESLGRALNDSEVETILLGIGHPMRVASAYLPGQEVVGKYLFPAYKKALEIALSLTFGLVVLMSLPGIIESQAFIRGAFSIFFEFFDRGLYVFAVVTLIFYFLGYYEVSLDKIYAWSPKELSSYSKKLELSRIETGFELVVYILFFSWWNNFVQWPADFLFQSETVAVSLSSEWQKVAWSINIVLGLSIVVGVFKFITARWNKASLAVETALSLSTIAICYQISQFSELVLIAEPMSEHANWDSVKTIVNQVVYSIISVITLICIWDIYSNTRKFMVR